MEEQSPENNQEGVQENNIQEAKHSIKPSRILPIIIGLIISLSVLIFGLSVFEKVFTRASDLIPRDVIIYNITNTSATLEFFTGQKAQSMVEYGISVDKMNLIAPETQSTKDHSIVLSSLTPSTTYYFQIKIGDKTFNNGGVPWTFVTKLKSNDVLGISTSDALKKRIKPELTPIESLVVDDSSSDQVLCSETNCQKICKLFFKSCSKQDFIKQGCIGKVDTKTCLVIPTPTGCLKEENCPTCNINTTKVPDGSCSSKTCIPNCYSECKGKVCMDDKYEYECLGTSKLSDICNSHGEDLYCGWASWNDEGCTYTDSNARCNVDEYDLDVICSKRISIPTP